MGYVVYVVNSENSKKVLRHDFKKASDAMRYAETVERTISGHHAELKPLA